MNICAELMKKYVSQVFPFLNFFAYIFFFLFLFLFVYLFILEGGIFLDNLFHGLPQSTKVTTGNGLKLASFNVLLFFYPKVFLKSLT